MRYVIDELGDRASGEGAPAQSRSVACVAGHGAFDEAVTAMLAQLLAARGLSVQSISNAQTGRDSIEGLNLTDVSVIAISYLEVTGSPAQLRYLIKRLRRQAPEARIVVGLWPRGEAALSDAAIQRAIGSDRYVGSLAEAVDAVGKEVSHRNAAAA
jgi:methylmalonyl-CoA mutase cobalamin-binding subunit